MTRFTLSLLLTTMPLLALACDSPGSLHPLIDELEQNRNIWDSLAMESYVYVVERQCFCPVEARGPVEVAVENGEITGRIYPETGEVVANGNTDLFPTVSGLFDVIEGAVEADAATIRVTWDEETGIPVDVWIDYMENVADEEVGFVVHSLPVASGG